jgi:hypothetical protein
MPAQVQWVQVTAPDQLHQAVSSYIVQGYTVANQTPSSATMMKKKEFSILWLVVGLILCVVPLLVYLIIYATQSDSVIEIRLVPEAALDSGSARLSIGGSSAGHPPNVQLSEDGRYWWDGTAWRDVLETAPTQVSDTDGSRRHATDDPAIPPADSPD